MAQISNPTMKYLWKLTLTDSDRNGVTICLKLFKTKAKAKCFAVQEINKYLTSMNGYMPKEEYVEFAESVDNGSKLNLDPITIKEFGTYVNILSPCGYFYDNIALGLKVILEENTNDHTFHMELDSDLLISY